ncbi:MAG: flagellar hook-basal body protein [Sphaerobacter sp.]|nr:flagellar hook-basal body protein [Sphaerobacter sp.]
MIRSMYQAASALMAQLTRQLTIGENLANASTPGYRARRTTVHDFREMFVSRVAGETQTPVGPISTAVRPDELAISLAQGSLVETGRPLDLAIAGTAFFAVQTPEGVRYTRDGRFHLDAQRRLVTSDGYPVLGLTGPLTLPEGDIHVTADGTILVNNAPVGQLQLVEFPPDAAFEPTGQNRFAVDAAGQQSQTAGVSQGFVEQANVDLTQNMVEMLEASRSYALAQRMLQVSDATLGLAVNEVGRVV